MADPAANKQPWIVQCSMCKHTWTACYLPMPLSDAARIMKNLTCPNCAVDSSKIVAFQEKS